jgi:2-methylisocitrate lyase-like PEP mutase family enzyme
MPSSKVIATTSFGIAAAVGVNDQDLTLEGHLNAIRVIAPIAARASKPLTVDAQDGYGDQLEYAIEALIDLGVSGVNIEDCDKDSLKMLPLEVASSRVGRALRVAKAKGVPDFVVNARIDSLLRGEEFDSVLTRGKAYLDAGATTVFVVDGPARRATLAEKKTMVEAFGGMLNAGVSVGEGHAAVEQMSKLGVARISVGPQLHIVATKAFQAQAERLLVVG